MSVGTDDSFVRGWEGCLHVHLFCCCEAGKFLDIALESVLDVWNPSRQRE